MTYVTLYTKEEKISITKEEWTFFSMKKICLHRTDGPAIEWADGTKAWYNNDTKCSALVIMAKYYSKEAILLSLTDPDKEVREAGETIMRLLERMHST